MKLRPAAPPVDLNDPRFDIVNGGHSVFSPSGSARWLWCPGSLIPGLLTPDDAGEEAAEGTVAHTVGETWLKEGERPAYLIGQVHTVDGFDITITKSMLAYVEEYVDWCVSLPGDHYTETKVWFSDLTPIPKQGGTADHCAIHGRTITITDLKFGKGVMVFAAEDLGNVAWCERDVATDEVVKINGNTQAMLYAYGYWRGLPEVERRRIERIVIRICQPRLGHFQVWETTIDELLDFSYWVRERAALAWTPGAPRRASEKGCTFCPIKKNCAALAAWSEDLHGAVFDDTVAEVDAAAMSDVKDVIDMGLYDPKLLRIGELSTEQMAKLIRFRKVFESWFNEMDAELERRALAGQPVPGMKLVDARVNRAFKSQRAAEKFLREQGVDTLELYKLSFASPAQAEEALVGTGMRLSAAKKLLEPLTDKPRGRTTLVPLSDPRQSHDAVADQVFGDTTADDL